MSLKDIYLQRSYETVNDRTSLINNFYIPTLQQTVYYDRIAGYFSSSALSIAAEGVAALIQNDGIMRLLISPELTESDAKIIKEGIVDDKLSLFEKMDFAKWMAEDNLRALAWMLDKEKLEIKIVVDIENKNTLFHQKIGLMTDVEGNSISFSGSINESAKAWLTNLEEFKVFKSWDITGRDYYNDDFRKFNRYWNLPNNNSSVKVFGIPEAIKNKIIKTKPDDIYELDLMKKYKKGIQKKELISLFDHQKDAIQMWKNNDKQLLNIMATGTGKTRTAIGCICELLKEKKKFITIISTPENSLTNQWLRDIEELKIPVDRVDKIESGTKWPLKLQNLFLDVQLGKYNNLVILTTHSLCCKEKFIKIVKQEKDSISLFYICDECHAIGSPKQKKALIEDYDYRLGLSATPERMFDDYGTSFIKKYFGDKKFEFGVYDALMKINPRTNHPYLNCYEYHPIFVNLSEKEWKKYKKSLTKIFLIQKSIEDNDGRYTEKNLEDARIELSNISKNAEEKYRCFDQLLSDFKTKHINNNIITFVSDKQIANAMDIAKRKGFFVAKITENETAKTKSGELLSERDKILKNFKEMKLNMLFGISCLDQGIDIPNARIAILMCNSINPREYIQRIGRVIRYAPNKDISLIYDFIVLPPIKYMSDNMNLLIKESRRSKEIACNAQNYNAVMNIYKRLGVNIDEY